MSIFKAKKQIPQSEIDVKSGRPVITPPRTQEQPEGEPLIIPATVNFQIEGVAPIELTDKEWKELVKFLEPIIARIPNISDIEIPDYDPDIT